MDEEEETIKRRTSERGKGETLPRRRRTDRQPLASAPDLPAQTPGADGPSSDEVAARAFELYERRGGEHGRAMDDWLEAERQLASEKKQKS